MRSSLSPTRRIAVALAALGFVTAIGTAGYMLIERLSAPDALYLTVITLTTVGYGDLVPRTTAGRIFTVLIILSGVGSALYLFTIGAQLVLEGQLRDVFGRTAMQRRADHMNGHVIVCGYGRFGRAVAEELGRNGAEMVVIDADAAREEELRRLGVPYVIGSAVADDVLEHAGIGRARAIVVATPSDPDNVFITLSAREKNPGHPNPRARRNRGGPAAARAGGRQPDPVGLSQRGHAHGGVDPASVGRRFPRALDAWPPPRHRPRGSAHRRLAAGSRAAPSARSRRSGRGCAWSRSSETARLSGSRPSRRRCWRPATSSSSSASAKR